MHLCSFSHYSFSVYSRQLIFFLWNELMLPLSLPCVDIVYVCMYIHTRLFFLGVINHRPIPTTAAEPSISNQPPQLTWAINGGILRVTTVVKSWFSAPTFQQATLSTVTGHIIQEYRTSALPKMSTPSGICKSCNTHGWNTNAMNTNKNADINYKYNLHVS